MSVYAVKGGDSPMTIAAFFTGDPYRVSELVMANPQKQRLSSGGHMTFESITPGEKLTLPRTWGGAFTRKIANEWQIGMGATDMMTAVDQATAEAACGNWTDASSYDATHPDVVDEAVDINSNGGFGNEYNYRYWKGSLLKFRTRSGYTTVEVCSALAPGWTPTGITPTGGPGSTNPPGTTATAKDTPAWVLPVAIVAAVGAGLGLAYVIRPKAHTSISGRTPSMRRR